MISGQLPSLLILLLLSSTYAAILDSVPSACTTACRPAASSLENCQFLTCICNDQQGRDFQSCLTCLYRLSPNNETYNAAQGTLQSFKANCKDKITVALNITSISPSGTSSSTPIPSSSGSSNSSTSSTSNSTSSTLRPSGSNSTSISQTPIPTTASSSNSTRTVSQSSTIIPSTSTRSSSAVIPTAKLGPQEVEQICRLRSDYPSRRIERLSTSYYAAEKKKPFNTRNVLAFLAVLIVIPIGVLVIRR